MIYVYIDLEGKVAKSEDEPTGEDIAAVKDGQLSLMRIEQDKFGNVFPELLDPNVDDDDPWYDVPQAQVETDDEGRPFHFAV